MRKFIVVLVAAFSFLPMMAESISSIEVGNSWIYLYNAQGKKYKTLSTSSVGTIKGYSSSFFVSQSGSWIYLWDADGRRYKTLAKGTVGEIIGVAGDTFTSRSGSWIYTWNKEGKKINTRSAN